MLAVVGALWLLNPSVAQAHPSGLQLGDAWWLAWHFDPLVAINVTLVLMAYLTGLVEAWLRAGVGGIIARWQAAAFVAGWLAVIIALLSPLDVLSDDLSWVHMTQHMVLMVVAAPLIMLGAPGLALVWAVPGPWRRTVARWLDRAPLGGARATSTRYAIVIWLFHAAILWGWHLPVLYELALVDPWVHDVEHLSFFLVACLFWKVAIDPRRHRRFNPGLAIFYLFTTSIHAMALGVLMALSPYLWYPVYVGRAERWNLTPLEDQQLAGLIMWMPACSVYALAAAGIFAAWLRELDTSPQGARSERRALVPPSSELRPSSEAREVNPPLAPDRLA